MRKKSFIVTVSALIVVLVIVIFKLLKPIVVWEINARQFGSSFNTISGDTATINDLSDFTAFKWDTLYSFAPYTPVETIYEVVGYRWAKINPTVSEGMNQVVFLKDGKVVCYIDGYPDKYKVFFNFGRYNGFYYKLTKSNNLAFYMINTDDGIKRLDYIK